MSKEKRPMKLDLYDVVTLILLSVIWFAVGILVGVLN